MITPITEERRPHPNDSAQSDGAERNDKRLRYCDGVLLLNGETQGGMDIVRHFECPGFAPESERTRIRILGKEHKARRRQRDGR